MTDAIEILLVDLLAAAGPDGSILSERLRALWLDVELEITSLRRELFKANSTIRIKSAEIRDLKGQIAKLSKIKFGVNADPNPEKGKAKMDNNADGNDGWDEEQPEPHKNHKEGNKATKRAPAPRNTNRRGRRVFPKHLERREIYMGTPDKKCPCGCGGSIRGSDINETLEVIPARHYVAVRRYPRYRCRVKDKVVGTAFPSDVSVGKDYSGLIETWT